MSETSPETIAEAQARVTEARQRLADTAGTLQARLDPRTVARDAVGSITESGEQALRTGMATAKRNPAVVAGAAAVFVAVLARKRIAALLTRKKPAPPAPAQPYGQRRVRLRPRPAPAKRND